MHVTSLSATTIVPGMDRHGIWADGKSREALPIDSRLQEITEKLLDAPTRVLTVQADTGAGKTTRIAAACALTTKADGSPAFRDIYVVQPRRTAVRWVAQRIASEFREAVGERVGYRLKGEEPRESSNTQIKLRVAQTLINQIIRDKKLPDGLIVVDEAHERSLTGDMLLGLIKQYLPQSPRTRILITSATIDTDKFSTFFDNAEAIKVEGRCFPVKKIQENLLMGEHHTEAAARITVEKTRTFLDKSLAIHDEPCTQGTVLVLLPGIDDIRAVRSEVERAANGNPAIEICICHGNTPAEEQDRAQAPLAPGTLRIVLATEVARSSVTFPETVIVIDSLQIKRLFVAATGITHLGKISVSKA